ncbi:MAG TPA: YezD family protein [Actinomycetota bacterium]|nr:YezD family protein [Actinomycetota bacterium]
MSAADTGPGPGPEDGRQTEPLDLDAFSDEERGILARVGTVLRRIEFGTVLLVVQDGKVVQIEMAEKFRLR